MALGVKIAYSLPENIEAGALSHVAIKGVDDELSGAAKRLGVVKVSYGGGPTAKPYRSVMRMKKHTINLSLVLRFIVYLISDAGAIEKYY